MNTRRFSQFAFGFAACLLTAAVTPAQALESLPEGETGLAAKYAGDTGIEKDPAVIIVDNFEDDSAVNDLRKKWDNVFHDRTIRIADEPENVHQGKKSVEFIFEKKNGEVGNGLMKQVKDEQDVLFLRFYEKFEKDLDVTGAGSFHNGGSLSAHYYHDGRSSAGKPADGRNFFLVSYEATVHSKAPPPGNLMVYLYYPEQRGDYGDIVFPTGVVSPRTSEPGNFGKDFVARPDVDPERGVWHCFEFMAKSNSVGQRDGRVACWMNGKLIADFPNLRFRDVDSLKLDMITIGGYVNPNKLRTNKIWFDDVVAAKSYIGPQSGGK